jgi:DNA-binding IclR family transcriptional regulator
MSHQAKNSVQSTVNTFAVVEALRELDGAGVSELSAHLDIPKSTVHNYLSTLEQEEYVINNDGVYRVGIRFLELGAYARNYQNIYDIAKPEIERLADETGELANLLIEEHGRGTYLQRVKGENAVQVEAHVGTRVALHSTALGKAILAFMPREQAEEIIDRCGLEQVTENTVTSPGRLFDELDRIRENRYALDDEERLRGLRCVAAPILSNDDRVLGSVSVSGPSNRIRGDRFHEELPKKVLEIVNVIELNVTYS